MKSTLSLAVAAVGVQQAAATFGNIGLGGSLSVDLEAAFSAATSFSCPLNIVNKCTPDQEKGWDFSDLAVGSFDAYAGFKFGGGWSCEDNSRKRGDIQGRTFGRGKVISGSCGLQGKSGLDIGLGSKAGIDAFSIGSFDLSTEFDARLEFHYDMADGSVCKDFADCKKAGSTIKNTQCGGAKKVRIGYSKQIDISIEKKEECKISFHKIKWHCGQPKVKPTTSRVVIPGTTTKVTETTPESVIATTSSQPGQETTTASVSGTTTNKPGQDTTTATVATQTTTFVTTFDSTSTVFTTSTKTITSCGPTVTECPGKTGAHVVTVTVPVSTTICPVTETRTHTKAVPTTVVLPGSKTESNVQTSAEKPTGQKPKPSQGPSCPPVVPKCLNTFLELKSKCKDNKDAACYCPNKEFVNTIFNCIYAHGENDNIISEAISFFQGLCGSYIPQNPAIATGAQIITEILTVTGTPRVTSVPYTTVVYATTAVDQSTTKTLSVEVTIPNIAVPPTGVQSTQAPVATQSGPAGEPVTAPVITGTGGVTPALPTGTLPVTAGAGRVGAGLLVAAVAFVAAL